MEQYDTVNEAVLAIRMRIWNTPSARECTYKSRADGACMDYVVQIGHQLWRLSFDNYGRATTRRA